MEEIYQMKKCMLLVLFLVVLGCLCEAFVASRPAYSAGATFYNNDLASFNLATGGSLTVQDFQSYTDGYDLNNIEFLPGIKATTNRLPLKVFNSGGNKQMFIEGDRGYGDAYYEITFSLPYLIVGLDILAFEASATFGDGSKAKGFGKFNVSFADGVSAMCGIVGNSDGDPIFIGVVADTPIASIRWTEALEWGGGNEETSLDNFRVGATTVPEPATMLLLGLGLVGIAGIRKRMAM